MRESESEREKMETAGDWVISERVLGHGMCGVVREGKNARTHAKVRKERKIAKGRGIDIKRKLTDISSLTGRREGREPCSLAPVLQRVHGPRHLLRHTP